MEEEKTLTTNRNAVKSLSYMRNALKKIKRRKQLYILVALPMLYIIIFKYVPMYGALIAFKDFKASLGILDSPWVGLKYFEQFVDAPIFWSLFKNTLFISLYSLIVGFPMPILLALALNELRTGFAKRMIQTVSYAPYFISTVVIVGMLYLALTPSGILNEMLSVFGIEPINFMLEPSYFRSIYVWSNIWQSVGYGSIIYIAALAGINPELYEAARVDGANRIRKIINIDIPGILPAIIIILILELGGLLGIGFEKIYLMQTPLNLPVSEVISTYVYKVGLLQGNYSFSTAVGLFNAIINLFLLVIFNYIARKTGNSLW